MIRGIYMYCKTKVVLSKYKVRSLQNKRLLEFIINYKIWNQTLFVRVY